MIALVVVSLAQFLIALDYSIVYLALPSMARGLALAPAVTPRVVSAYAVLFAGFLIVGGRLTDRFGAAPMFVIAILIFGVASGAGAAAGNGAMLLAARGVQGLGAALLQPAVLGLIGTRFPAGPARARALSVWAGVGAGGLAAGVLLGGLLTAVSWRLTLLVNVPPAVACAAVGWVAFEVRVPRGVRVNSGGREVRGAGRRGPGRLVRPARAGIGQPTGRAGAAANQVAAGRSGGGGALDGQRRLGVLPGHAAAADHAGGHTGPGRVRVPAAGGLRAVLTLILGRVGGYAGFAVAFGGTAAAAAAGALIAGWPAGRASEPGGGPDLPSLARPDPEPTVPCP